MNGYGLVAHRWAPPTFKRYISYLHTLSTTKSCICLSVFDQNDVCKSFADLGLCDFELEWFK
jgi:hypothetical protein